MNPTSNGNASGSGADPLNETDRMNNLSMSSASDFDGFVAGLGSGSFDSQEMAINTTSSTSPTRPEAPAPKSPARLPPRHPQSAAKHQRKVSWGGSELLSTERPAGILRDRSGSSTGSPQRPKVTPQGIIEIPLNLNIVNPMEAEAEAHILRAIEKARPETQPPVLTNVPDQAVDIVTAEPPVDEDGESMIRQNTESAKKDEDKTQSIHSTSIAAAKNVQRNRHNRKPTMDQQLAGLTIAIETLHAENQFSFLEPLDDPDNFTPRSRNNTLESVATGIEPVAEEEDEHPVTSFDTFAQNAEKMFESQAPERKLVRMQTMRRRRASSAANYEDTLEAIKDEDDQALDEEMGAASHASDPSKKKDDDNGLPPSDGRSDSPSPATPWSKKVTSLMFDEWAFVGGIKSFILPQKSRIYMILQLIIVYIGLPSLGAAAILFYFTGNPPTGRYAGQDEDGTLRNTSGSVIDPAMTSISYYLLFFGVRQMTTLLMALGTQLMLIDYLAIDRGYLFRFGARIPLFVMQARGWPFVLFAWSLYDWALISGKHPFFAHWLYFQNAIGLFNESNPDGNLADSEWNRRVLALASGIPVAVAIKRFWMGIFLGKQTYYQYSDKLAVVMKKILLITQVATLSRQVISNQGRIQLKARGGTVFAALSQESIGEMVDDADEDKSEPNADESMSHRSGTLGGVSSMILDPDDRNPLTGKLSQAQKNRIVKLLGVWEEPTEVSRTNESISISSLMHFRRAVRSLRTDLPFSASFGAAGNREDCITNAQEVFRRLMILSESDDTLDFEVLALLGAKSDGTLDHDKLMDLIKLFRPDRDGSLSMVHFVRSIDNVYKEIRLLRASVSNSTRVDGQFESVFNIGFYAAVFVVSLYVFGIDPLALFVSVSGIVVSVSFMIGSASSSYFQGLIFILIRCPYSIGDCINVSSPTVETPSSGSPFWIVEDITLFATQVRFSFTNERASLSNGAMAESRIINSTKSTNAALFHTMKFPIGVSNEKVAIFQDALERFIRNRPREWLGLGVFRACDVNASLGYIEYLVAMTHRESWAQWGQIRMSQSDVMRFGVELAKKLDIVYEQPALPVNFQNPLKFSPQGQGVAPGLVHPLADPTGSGASVRSTGNQSTMEDSISGSLFQSLEAQFPPRAPK